MANTSVSVSANESSQTTVFKQHWQGESFSTLWPQNCCVMSQSCWEPIIITQHFLCTRHHSECFTFMCSFNPCKQSMRLVLLIMHILQIMILSKVKGKWWALHPVCGTAPGHHHQVTPFSTGKSLPESRVNSQQRTAHKSDKRSPKASSALPLHAVFIPANSFLFLT